MAMAVDVFHAQITDTRMEVTDLVLKLRMMLLTHETTWALLRPEEWTDVVRDGDEIRMGRRDVGPGPFVIFKYPTQSDIIHRNEHNVKCVTMLLPKTCEVSYAQIGLERRGLNHPTYIKEIKTSILIEFGFDQYARFNLARILGAGSKAARIPPAQWSTAIRQFAKEDPSCQILIQKY